MTPSAFQLGIAARIVATGGVIAYPTEAVWGLGCDPGDADAVARLLALKQRDPAKGLILVAAEIGMFAPLLAGLAPALRRRLEATWPGPVTWLVPHCGRAPAWIAGRHATVALRVSAHPVVVRLVRAVGTPLVSTSANPAGRRPARNALDVHRYFADAVDYLLPGTTGGHQQPTEIRDLETGAVVRPA